MRLSVAMPPFLTAIFAALFMAVVCAQPPAPVCERFNVALAATSSGSSQQFGCNVPAGTSHDLVVRNPNGRRLFFYFTFGPFCAQPGSAPPRSYGGRWSPGGGTTANLIEFNDAPCAGFVGGPDYSSPCCVVIACSVANAFTGGCANVFLDTVFNRQMQPFNVGGCSSTSVPLSLAGTGTSNTVSCATPGIVSQNFQIANPNLARLNVYSTSGPSCSLLPSDEAFQYLADYSVDSSSNPISIVGAPCLSSPCCTVISCNIENVGSGCPFLSYTGAFVLAPPSPSPSPQPTVPPSPFPACGATQAALPVLMPGTQLSALCSVRAPLSSQNALITNPTGARLLLWFSDGVFCAMSPFNVAFQDHTIYRRDTTAATISTTGVPCIREPCCVIIGCSSLGGACGNIQLTSEFIGPTDSTTPSASPSVSMTPSATLSPGASESPTPSFTTTPSQTLTPTMSSLPVPSASSSPAPSAAAPNAGACSFPAIAPGLTAGGSTPFACNIATGTSTLTISNPSANSLSVFFPTGPSCRLNPGDPAFQSAPALDIIFTVSTSVTRVVPCFAPMPCCFVVRCDLINEGGCPAVSVAASFSDGSTAQAAAGGLSTGAIAGISVGVSVFVLGAAALAAWAFGVTFNQCSRHAAPSHLKGATISSNPLSMQFPAQPGPVSDWVKSSVSMPGAAAAAT